MEIASGRYFTDEEIERKAKVVVLGSAAAKSLFGTESAVGQYVTVGTTKLAVIGVFKERGLVGNTDFNSRVYMPIKLVFQKFTFNPFARFLGDQIRMIYVEVDPKADQKTIIQQIELLLVKRHDVTLESEDFTITTQQDIISTREIDDRRVPVAAGVGGGGIADRGRHRHHEHHAGKRDRADSGRSDCGRPWGPHRRTSGCNFWRRRCY